MGITISEAVRNELISSEIVKLLPNKCRCGHDLVFSDSLRELKCTDNKCKQTVINRAIQFFNKLNIEISASDIKAIVEKFNIITPFQFMMIIDIYESDEDMLSDIHNVDSLIQNLKNIKQNEYLLYEIVELCYIENITKIAKKIFFGFNSIEEAYNEIEVGQLSFINERLGIKSSDSSILSVEIFNELLDIKEELIFGETQFKVKNSSKKRLFMAFADNVIPFVNKSELMDWLNSTYEYEFVQITTISDYTDILIRNANSNSNKIRSARLINDKYIADSINNGDFTLNDINKTKQGELKPIGSKVYIDTLENIIEKLNKLKENNNICQVTNTQ